MSAEAADNRRTTALLMPAGYDRAPRSASCTRCLSARPCNHRGKSPDAGTRRRIFLFSLRFRTLNHNRRWARREAYRAAHGPAHSAPYYSALYRCAPRHGYPRNYKVLIRRDGSLPSHTDASRYARSQNSCGRYVLNRALCADDSSLRSAAFPRLPSGYNLRE